MVSPIAKINWIMDSNSFTTLFKNYRLIWFETRAQLPDVPIEEKFCLLAPTGSIASNNSVCGMPWKVLFNISRYFAKLSWGFKPLGCWWCFGILLLIINIIIDPATSAEWITKAFWEAKCVYLNRIRWFWISSKCFFQCVTNFVFLASLRPLQSFFRKILHCPPEERDKLFILCGQLTPVSIHFHSIDDWTQGKNHGASWQISMMAPGLMRPAAETVRLTATAFQSDHITQIMGSRQCNWQRLPMSLVKAQLIEPQG